jgi:phenylpyruvate tautomerase PptA (4-oxalocrotonate tautomerase family)
VRLPAGRFDTLTKQHLISDLTKIVMLAEGKPFVSEDANRVWVTIVELQRDDWGIGGHTDWLRDYESALNTLGTDLKPR